METWKLLPPDTRIQLDNLEKLSLAIDNNKANILGISKQKISRYKKGINRPTKKEIDKLSEISGIDLKIYTKRMGLEASEHVISLPLKLTISSKMAWLIGFHSTENSETPKNYGVCNTEVTLIKEALDILVKELSIPRELIKVEIRYPSGSKIKKIINDTEFSLNIKKDAIRIRKINEGLKTLYTIRINSRLIRNIMDNLEIEFLRGAGKKDKSIICGYLKGVFDADAWFNGNKNIIVIAQKKKEIIEIICNLLKILKIDYRKEYWRYRNYYVCVIKSGKNRENLKRYMESIGFLHPLKATRVKNSIASLCRS